MACTLERTSCRDPHPIATLSASGSWLLETRHRALLGQIVREFQVLEPSTLVMLRAAAKEVGLPPGQLQGERWLLQKSGLPPQLGEEGNYV